MILVLYIIWDMPTTTFLQPTTVYFCNFSPITPDNPKQEHWDNLAKGVKYFIQRTETPGNMEEGWFAHLKLGEIYERFYRDWPKAMKYYENCAREDPVRADPWFYLGQHYRLT